MPDTTRTGSPLGSTRSTVTPPSDSGSGRTVVAGRVGQPHQIGLLGGHEGRPEELLALAAADQHTRRAGVAAPQVQLVLGAQRRGETKGLGKRFGLDQVRLLELQPDDVVDFDDRVGRAPRVFSWGAPCSLCSSLCGAYELVGHRCFSF